MIRCLLIDYGLGNLASVTHALEHCGADVSVQTRPERVEVYSHLVLPGVGSFSEGMHNLRERGWVDPIRIAVRDRGARLLGICLGMQLLAEHGSEGGGADGLGLIEGEVDRLVPDEPDTRIPHMGWNEVHLHRDASMLDASVDGFDFYFLHSYHFVPREPEKQVATTSYCGGFTSIVGDANILGVQFHPEKSQKLGLRLLSHFLAN